MPKWSLRDTLHPSPSQSDIKLEYTKLRPVHYNLPHYNLYGWHRKNISVFDMGEVNDKSQSTHQSPNIGNSGGNTRVFNNARIIDVGHRPSPPRRASYVTMF